MASSIDYLLLVGELEGCSAHLKKLEAHGDCDVIREMVARYYRLYFKTKKNEQQSQCDNGQGHDH